MVKITNINQLKDRDFSDCFISIGGIGQSSKEIYYYASSGMFNIWNSIDDSYEELTEQELTMHSIGIAIKNKRLYRYE